MPRLVCGESCTESDRYGEIVRGQCRCTDLGHVRLIRLSTAPVQKQEVLHETRILEFSSGIVAAGVVRIAVELEVPNDGVGIVANRTVDRRTISGRLYLPVGNLEDLS